MSDFGKTWWGQKWLETFRGIDFSNRLSRGRSYARNGRAYNIKITNNIITARVRGSRRTPYKVTIIPTKFNEEQQQIIREVINNSPIMLSALINKKLPPQLLTKLNDQQIKLFPANWEEIYADCSCPDWALPCKHIAAVIYLICAEIDKNPFMIFHIHDCNLLNLIDIFKDGKLTHTQQIPKIEQLFIKQSRLENPSNESFNEPTQELSNIEGNSEIQLEMQNQFDFSKIPPLLEQISEILPKHPVFYNKNFLEILIKYYKRWQRYPHGAALPRFLINNNIGRNNVKQQESSEDSSEEPSTEQQFFSKWIDCEQWQHLQITINDNHQLIQIQAEGKEILKDFPNLQFSLIVFLNDIPNATLIKLCPTIRFLHLIAQFAAKLMTQAAIIPQILQNNQGYTIVRWIPALFDPETKYVFTQLCDHCPENLIQFQKHPMHNEEQVKTLIALMLAGYINNNPPNSFSTQHLESDLIQLFFYQQPYKFTSFEDASIPNAIYQWLSHLYLSEKPHKLYIKVTEIKDEFAIALQISLNNQTTPISISQALAMNDDSLKLRILSDISLITTYIPQLEETIDNKSAILFTLDDFAPLFLKILPIMQIIGIEVILPKALQQIIKPKMHLKLKSTSQATNDRKSFLNLDKLLSFDWQIALGDNKTSITKFKEMLSHSQGLLKFHDEYVLLDDKEIDDLIKHIDKLPKQLSTHDLMQAVLANELAGANVDIDENLKSLFATLTEYPPIALPTNLDAKLRPYQELGFRWLVQNINIGFGSILADDMGLGKTIQVIATILHYKNQGLLTENPVLIIAPTSLLSNWQKEIERFAPELNLDIYHGNNRELTTQFDILLTSYGLVRRDKKQLNNIPWFLLVIDEAQNIKNPSSEQTRAIKTITAKHKIAMSGTPVENRLLEYWSIFDFTNKNYLGNTKQFKQNYATPIEAERDQSCLLRFKKITSPFILRRLKSDKTIIDDLPEKIENNSYCSLTSEQTALYEAVVQQSIQKIEQSEGIERKGLVLQLINALKQICNHPSQYLKQKTAAINQSGKLQILEEILLNIDQSAEKSLIFTQYTEMGTILASLLYKKFNIEVPFLHGGLARKARDQIVNDFQLLSQKRILIVSLKAGGTGLNLTAANHVIHYDLWWNPAVEAQATDRAYRIGQKRNVMVHRLLTKGTFEENIDEMIQNKKELANLTVGSGENWITEMTTEQIQELVTLRNIKMIP